MRTKTSADHFAGKKAQEFWNEIQLVVSARAVAADLADGDDDQTKKGGRRRGAILSVKP